MLLFMDGVDKYGSANSNATGVAALLTAGEWTTSTNTVTIVAPLSTTGNAANLANSTVLSKTLPASYGRLIGGFRFSSTLAGNVGVQFIDVATQQAGISINTAGTISVRNGNFSAGTALGTSAASITANTVHYLEWDITFGNSGAYQLWLDGVSILSGTGDTTATANNTASGIQLATAATGVMQADDLYLFDATGSINNAVLLTSPRIETQFPSADGAVQFAVGAATLGNSVQRAGSAANGANYLYLRPYTPTRNCTLNSISFLPAATSATLNARPVVYADVAGAPNGGALLSAGSTVTGVTSGTLLNMPLTTPVGLIAGTQYWLGLMLDIVVSNVMALGDSLAVGRSATSTFASGAPATCPATAAGGATVVVYGNITLSPPVNYYEVASQPVQGMQSYVFDSVVGHEDLYAFPVLSAPPSAIYAVAVKANLSKSDAGAKTASVRLKSGATDSAGSGGTALAPGTSFGWMTSHYERDPNGNIAWTKTALDAAQAGVKVET